MGLSLQRIFYTLKEQGEIHARKVHPVLYQNIIYNLLDFIRCVVK